MRRDDEPRELTRDDIVAVANECRDAGIDAYKITTALWSLDAVFSGIFGSRYRDVCRQAFMTWESALPAPGASRARQPRG